MSRRLVINNNYIDYNQYLQKIAINFAFLKEEVLENGDTLYTELHYPVMCREFLCETIVLENLGVTIEDSDEEEDLLDLESRVDLTKSLFSIEGKADYLNNIVRNKKILEEVETLLIGESSISIYKDIVIVNTTGSEKRIVIEANPKWFSSPLLISILSLVIRMCCYNIHSKATFKDLYDLIIDIGKNENEDKDDFEGTNGDYGTLYNIPYNTLVLILSNIDKILGENPLFGIDDFDIISKVKKEPPNNRYYGYKTDSIYWCFSDIHNATGVSSIMFLVRKKMKDYKCLGYLWANNINKLLEETK